jgi:hypothetical protein
MIQPQSDSTSLSQILKGHLLQVRQALQQADLTAAARQTGFLQRLPRKIPMLQFVLALISLAAETTLSLERVASVISLAAGVSYSKQALHQRLSLRLESFLGQIATLLFGQLSRPTQGWLAPFTRVLLHDSTVHTLPHKLAHAFPGAANARPHAYAAFKLQFICDLLHARVLRVSLSSFRRNDQAAAGDILPLVQPGDLILRDLGYFALAVLEQIDLLHAYFLTRCRHGVSLYENASGRALDLRARLRPGQSLDIDVRVGPGRVPARLVAVPLPEAIANQRRRKACSTRNQPPSAKKLYLLSWNIFLTNVSRRVWPLRALCPIYRLRWRIEIIFKAWKSHLGFRALNCRTPDLVRLSVLTKLLFCIAVYRLCDALELLGDAHHHVSLLRLARIMGQCALWFAITFLGLSAKQWLEWHLARHLFYEQRADRKNFYELLAEASTP